MGFKGMSRQKELTANRLKEFAVNYSTLHYREWTAFNPLYKVNVTDSEVEVETMLS